MSEEKYMSVDDKKREIITPTGRYVFSRKALGSLSCTFSELEKNIKNADDFKRLWTMIVGCSEYKWKVQEDKNGKYISIRRKTEDSQRIPTISLDEEGISIERKIPRGEGTELLENVMQVDTEKEQVEEDIDYANTVYGSSSIRETTNKDTREINLRALLNDAITGKRSKKATRSINLNALKQANENT